MATSDLPELPKYSELVQLINNGVKEKTPLIYDFMKTLTKNYIKGDKANEIVFGTDYHYEKFNINYNEETEKFLESYNIKPHQLFKTIHQISIAKIKKTNIPLILNVNSKRDDKWKSHYSCQLKNHPFYFEVDPEHTLEKQIRHNEQMNKKMLEVYGPIDAYLVGCDLLKDLIPTGQFVFNFVYNDEPDVIFRPDLRLETRLNVDFPMNIYFELYYRKNGFINAFYISKLNSVTEAETLQMKSLLVDIYQNLPNYWNKKLVEF